jgi:hypothetical protein
VTVRVTPHVDTGTQVSPKVSPWKPRAGPYPIYVPRPESAALQHVLPASAIVGFPLRSDPDTIHVYYEGNRYHSPDMLRFADRVKFAASRCRNNYPTTAQAHVRAADLFHVALYDEILGLVTPLGDDQAALLATWIHSGAPQELQATGPQFPPRRHQLGHPNGSDNP